MTLTTAYQANAKTCHGRTERREMWVLADAAVAAYAGSAGTVGKPWPHLQQLCWFRRERTMKGVTSVESGSAITSLVAGKADAVRLMGLSRAYGGIENKLPWVRDVTCGEDASQVRSGAAPQGCAALRNLAIALLRRAGVENIAAALRTHSARPRAAVALVLSPLQE